MSEKQVFKTTWGGRPLQIEVGQLAKQANGAVLVRYGDTVVLSAAVASKEAKDTDFFPLTTIMKKKMYAARENPWRFHQTRRSSKYGSNIDCPFDRPSDSPDVCGRLPVMKSK